MKEFHFDVLPNISPGFEAGVDCRCEIGEIGKHWEGNVVGQGEKGIIPIEKGSRSLTVASIDAISRVLPLSGIKGNETSIKTHDPILAGSRRRKVRAVASVLKESRQT